TARVVHAPTGRGAFAAAPARARLGLRVRQPLEHRGRLRAPASAQDRRAVRAHDTRDGSRRRLPPAQRQRAMSHIPIRLKGTAAFAIAMAAVLAGSGLFLYLRLSSHLAVSLDRELRVRWQDVAALVSDPRATLSRDSRGRFIERGESYAELVS